jgi:hypothetical protein
MLNSRGVLSVLHAIRPSAHAISYTRQFAIVLLYAFSQIGSRLPRVLYR